MTAATPSRSGATAGRGAPPSDRPPDPGPAHRGRSATPAAVACAARRPRRSCSPWSPGFAGGPALAAARRRRGRGRRGRSTGADAVLEAAGIEPGDQLIDVDLRRRGPAGRPPCPGSARSPCHRGLAGRRAPGRTVSGTPVADRRAGGDAAVVVDAYGRVLDRPADGPRADLVRVWRLSAGTGPAGDQLRRRRPGRPRRWPARLARTRCAGARERVRRAAESPVELARWRRRSLFGGPDRLGRQAAVAGRRCSTRSISTCLATSTSALREAQS